MLIECTDWVWINTPGFPVDGGAKNEKIEMSSNFQSFKKFYVMTSNFSYRDVCWRYNIFVLVDTSSKLENLLAVVIMQLCVSMWEVGLGFIWVFYHIHCQVNLRRYLLHIADWSRHSYVGIYQRLQRRSSSSGLFACCHWCRSWWWRWRSLLHTAGWSRHPCVGIYQKL